jgi:hypothetical protein
MSAAHEAMAQSCSGAICAYRLPFGWVGCWLSEAPSGPERSESAERARAAARRSRARHAACALPRSPANVDKIHPDLFHVDEQWHGYPPGAIRPLDEKPASLTPRLNVEIAVRSMLAGDRRCIELMVDAGVASSLLRAAVDGRRSIERCNGGYVNSSKRSGASVGASRGARSPGDRRLPRPVRRVNGVAARPLTAPALSVPEDGWLGTASRHTPACLRRAAACPSQLCWGPG